MKKEDRVLKVTLCGPGDVSKEVEIAKKVISEWNRINWEATGCGLVTRHWRTNSVPDLGERAQRVIDRQLIDESDLVIGIFWNRLGTPTGLAPSGTVEEIDRAVHRDIRTMVYFSNLEAPEATVDAEQVKGLEEFRSKLLAMGLASSFPSRRHFENDFRIHLGLAVHQILAEAENGKSKQPRAVTTRITQKGENNVLVSGDGNVIKPTMPSKPTIIIPQSPGQISPSEQKRVSDLVNELAALNSAITGKSEGASRAEMRSRFINHFDIPRYNALESSRMREVEDWYRVVRGTLIRSPKARRGGYSDAEWKTAIKTKMKAMGRTNEDYYPEIAARLKIPKFTSLTKLSSKHLEKVCNLVRRDSGK